MCGVLAPHRAEKLAPGPVRFHHEVTDVVQNEHAVTATVADHDTGETYRVRSRYLLACDGGRTVGPGVGIAQEGVRNPARVVTFRLSADLSRWARDPEVLIRWLWLPDLGVPGALVPMGPLRWGPDVDDPNWRAVHDLVANGQAKLHRDHAAAVPLFEEALGRTGTGAAFSDHDQLYAYYGLVYALSRLVNANEGLTDKLIGYAERALALVPEPRKVWHFIDEGQFQEEVTRTAGNTLAWHLMKRGELDRALSIVDRALTFGAHPTYDHIRDTKVRILLAMGRTTEAYLIVDHVLARCPDFGDFASAPEFRQWRAVTARC